MITENQINKWFRSKNWKPFKFQTDTWNSFLDGKSGLVNAPTGSGKTYSLVVPIILEHQRRTKLKQKGLCAIWITPIRALAKEIFISSEKLVSDLGIDFTIEIRTGDSTAKTKASHKLALPNLLITTPESLHILMAQKNFSHLFRNIFTLIADEWHELLGSKRGVQLELSLSKLRDFNNDFRTWGISATIGNLEQATEVLLGSGYLNRSVLINSGIKKKIVVKSILPKEIGKFPWSGHLGVNLIDEVLEIIHNSTSTLIFTNTRAQSEIWYNKVISASPELSGIAALHHSALSKKVRYWVEDELQAGNLKVVICTSSLDLGVDFSPVESIIQIGGPKGVSRFVQRAGRSGHKPGETSRVYFVPTHSLELIEAAALRQAINDNYIEKREPYIMCFDVLIQYLLTLAVGEGFNSRVLYKQVKSTFCFASISSEEWKRVMHFLKTGGDSLGKYEEFKKTVEIDGLTMVIDRATVRRHKMSIGTIVSDNMIKVHYKSGGYIGNVEEWFISRLNEGDVFWFAGKSLELISLKQLKAKVVRSKKKTGLIPTWKGGTLPMSSNMSEVIRSKIDQYIHGDLSDVELKIIDPLLNFQKTRSHLPKNDEFLVEYFKTDQGYHLIAYPFEGRFVNEGIASLLAFRLSKLKPISFSIAFNDYGFELLSDQFLEVEILKERDLLSSINLLSDIESSINGTEMASRKFRDIAFISGLLFKGFPGRNVKDRHLQSSSELFFNVFSEYDSQNLLLKQSYEEAMIHQLDYERLRKVLLRIEKQTMIIKYPHKPTPFGFPIMVDRLREKLSSETLASRIKKMTLKFE